MALKRELQALGGEQALESVDGVLALPDTPERLIPETVDEYPFISALLGYTDARFRNLPDQRRLDMMRGATFIARAIMNRAELQAVEAELSGETTEDNFDEVLRSLDGEKLIAALDGVLARVDVDSRQSYVRYLDAHPALGDLVDHIGELSTTFPDLSEERQKGIEQGAILTVVTLGEYAENEGFDQHL